MIVNSSSQRRRLLAAFLIGALVAVPLAHARTHHSDAWARERFAAAERMREALNGRPAAERTRHDYQRVLNAYRSVYLGAPASSKADPSVVAAGETLVEMGHRFNDDKILHSAIDQYKFLRREYPGSKFRCDALFTIAEIYKDDLNDSQSARSAFQEFLKRYPHNRLVDDARDAIADLDREDRSGKLAATGQGMHQTAKNSADAASKDLSAKDENTRVIGKNESSQPQPIRFPRVTALRHWATPDYTRVAIDLEGDVKFSSQRLENPARIFFDLRNTRLASTLVGKSFDIDDSFLKKVRLAQFAPGRTRVVLEIDNVSDYDAFLLPNPYRLIIDIHGKSARDKPLVGKDDTEAAKKDDPSSAPAATAASAQNTDLVSDHSTPSPLTTITGRIANDAGRNATTASRGSSPEIATATVVKKIVEADDDDPAGENGFPAGQKKREKKLTSEARNTAGTRIHGRALDHDSNVSDREAPSDDSESAAGLHGKNSAPASSNVGSAYDFTPREAKPTASGDRSLIRTLGLKIGKIVIDPGHGGHDTGTIGPNGLEEKDLVLDVGRRLGKLLETRLGAEVVYTRKDDTFIPLETRTAIANQARADLFVSIHANSSQDSSARGVETYYLNFTSSPEALEVAARENAVSEKSVFELQDLVKKIALKEKIEESREFAGDVQQSLHSSLAAKSPAIRDRGVKKAPFIVLIGANMPSILAEISFVSNPTDERRLETAEYRERIAESLYRGIAKYANGLSGVKIASKLDKTAGQ